MNPYPVPERLLKRTIPMQRGNDVKWLQWELVDANLLAGNGIDGIFGDRTLAALKTYQQLHGLLVDGKCGPATRYAMLNYC